MFLFRGWSLPYHWKGLVLPKTGPSMQQHCCLLGSLLTWMGCQPSPSPPGVGTQPLFWGEKGKNKGSRCLIPAGALAGASVSHRHGGAVAPPCFHHTPLVTAPCPVRAGLLHGRGTGGAMGSWMFVLSLK